MSKAFDERMAEKKAAEETEYRKVLIRTAIGRVPLCGCGSSERMWEIVRDILQRSEEVGRPWKPGEARPPSFYDPMGDWPGDAVEFAAQVLNESGMMEHGSGIGHAWLTAPGKVVLCFLRKYGCGDREWPEWARSSYPPEQHALTDAEWRSFTFKDRDSFTEEMIP